MSRRSRDHHQKCAYNLRMGLGNHPNMSLKSHDESRLQMPHHRPRLLMDTTFSIGLDTVFCWPYQSYSSALLVIPRYSSGLGAQSEFQSPDALYSSPILGANLIKDDTHHQNPDNATVSLARRLATLHGTTAWQ